MYNSLKNEIINRFDILNDKLIFIQDNEFENYNPNEDFDYDDFLELVTNLKECLELTILELPVMEEANYSLKQMEEQIDRLYVSEKNRDLYNIWHIDKPKNYSSSKKERIKPYKENKLSWEEEKFNKEADLWGLSEEDRRIAKQERMSPAEFIEAEERDDDELDTDEWEN